MTSTATCDPSNYISSSNTASGPSSPGPSMFTLPPPAEAGVPSFSGDIFAQIMITKPSVSNFAYDAVMARYADVAECKMFDPRGHQAVHDCYCDKCFSLIQECDALVSCQAITKCFWDAGCTDSNSCYFSGTCSAPVDKYGTHSVGTYLANALGTCRMNNGCPAQ
jgi:hypothetical protein